jgi:macrolide-specific efflux system membrane fusion protein
MITRPPVRSPASIALCFTVMRPLLTVFACALASFSTSNLGGEDASGEKVSGKGEQTLEVDSAQVSLIQNTFVATSIAGIVAEVSVSEGDRVKLGDRLVQLDTEQAKTELEAAKATLDAATLQSANDVNVRYARRTMEVRQRELEQSLEANQRLPGTFSESEISKQQLEVDQARLAIEQAEHDHSVARAKVREKEAVITITEARLRRHGINAPVSGRVVEVAVEPGEWVDTGKPVVRIVSLDPVRVECFIDGSELGEELVGRKVVFYPASSRQAESTASPLTGHVTFVSPELHPVTGQARLWATVANPHHAALAGMQGRLLIEAP